MNLNPFTLFKKSSKGYIGLLLRETDGIIMYLEVNPATGSLEKIDSEKFALTSRWDHLADDVDDALYKLEVRTKKTFDDIIFFVYSHLVEPDTHEIKKLHLASIKNLVKSMELKPLGFIEVYEAYLKYMLSRDRQPLTSVVVESDDTVLTVFTYQSGALVSQISANRKKSFTSDLSEALAAVKETVELPPSIILLPSKDGQEGADLVEYSWDEKLFGHQPSILVVTEDEMVNSLITTFSAQITEVVVDEHSTSMNSAHSTRSTDSGQASSPQAVPISDEVSMQERMGFMIGGETEENTDVIRPAFTNSITRLYQSALSGLPAIKQRLGSLGIFRSRKLFVHSSIVVGVVLILASLIFIELNLHKAVVTMTLPSQKIELTRSFDAKLLGLKEASEAAKFDARSTATGVKSVGQPAKGTVTIYNSSLTQSKTFAKGTSLVAVGNLEFTLDSEVKLASASGDAVDIVSSSAKAAVTASAIGPESNLANGTKFSVADESSSSVIAKADSALTGGTKSQIQVVSEKDVANAEAQIITKAQNFIQTKVEKTLGKDFLMLKPLTTVTTKSQVSDNEVGTEAGSVELKSDVVIGYSYVSAQKLREVIVKTLQPKVQKGLSITDKNLTFNILKINVEDNDVELSLKATARAVAPITDEEILNSIAGKTVSALQNLAKEKYHAQSVEFTVEHPVDALKNILPLFSGNIKLRLLYP